MYTSQNHGRFLRNNCEMLSHSLNVMRCGWGVLYEGGVLSLRACVRLGAMG
uniref:Uncharacterized protein n=1 Tax=Picea glauca TaxID=3330 RepID=A0A101M0C7_PICGL|nr:hypothetical protein ABT39_MTgene4568 [Picea glauca]QHR91972.1 hypothetical protein Q903MT_gene6008 [Picea sitchensis]